jgi:hypothetical protein
MEWLSILSCCGMMYGKGSHRRATEYDNGNEIVMIASVGASSLLEWFDVSVGDAEALCHAIWALLQVRGDCWKL